MADPSGYGVELEHLVWEPYARAATLHSARGLELKLGCLALLLVVTLLCGFLPLWILHRPGGPSGPSGKGPKGTPPLP